MHSSALSWTSRLSLLYYYYENSWYLFRLITQNFFKAIHYFVSLNGPVLTLSVFYAYSKITKLDALSLSIIQYAITIKKTINEILKYTT